MRLVACLSLILSLSVAPAMAERAAFLDLARKGWVYELRSAMWRPDPLRPAVQINGRNMAGASLCIVGERPHPQMRLVLDGFRTLITDVFQKPVPMRFAGPDLSGCGTGRTLYLRLYSGVIPHRAFNDDLRRIDYAFGIGLPRDRDQYVMSPAQAQTFFGRRGQATHLLVMQPSTPVLTPLQSQFYASLLIEELYQSFTFGMDILHFDRQAAFLSKLEEFPINLRNVPWDSPRFMQGLLQSNPGRLCRFDVFMLHALAQAPVARTNSEAFLQFIDSRFDDLLRLTNATAARPDLAPVFDARCSGPD